MESLVIMKAKFVYVGIRVKDLQKSIDFYSKLLGMRVTGRSRFEQTRVQTVNLESKDGGFTLELYYYEEASPFNVEYVMGEGLDHLAFKVSDLDSALREAELVGYPTILQVKTHIRWAYIEDPNGIWIELYQ